MDRQEKDQLIVVEHPSVEPEIGRWLWALEDSRRRTLKGLEGLTQEVIDWLPPDNESSIGTVLYHIALIEADWLFTEVIEQSYPPEAIALFPQDVRDEKGSLTQLAGLSLEQHLERLESVRAMLLAAFERMDFTDFRRARALPSYDVTPEWVLHHLMQHEAEHRGQIGALRAAAQYDLAR